MKCSRVVSHCWCVVMRIPLYAHPPPSVLPSLFRHQWPMGHSKGSLRLGSSLVNVTHIYASQYIVLWAYTGNGETLSSSQAGPGQAIKSAVASGPSSSCLTSCVHTEHCAYDIIRSKFNHQIARRNPPTPFASPLNF